jgi:Zn finger protein HypA/HybF involved in hydrogenase expression
MKKVLILGDGNFSFSLALAKLLDQKHSTAVEYLGSANTELICTSFDSYAELISKYHDCERILRELKEYAQVLHGVNAWELHEFRDIDLVVWNHPHLGTEDFRLHQFLISHFFHSAKQILSETGRIRVSLVQGQETRWNVFVQAERVGLHLETMEVFDELKWPGYVVKRNTHGGSFKNIHTKKHVRTPMKSCVYTFGTASDYIQMETIPSLLTSLFGNNFESTFEKKALPSIVSELTPTREAKKNKKASAPTDLVCPHCQKQLFSVRGYQQHVHMVHILKKFGDWKPDRPKEMQCKQCEKRFADADALAQHEINKHTSVDVAELPELFQTVLNVKGEEEYQYYPCPVCGQSCVNQEWGMDLHLERLKPVLGLNMKCPQCPNTFIEQRALLQHIKFCRIKNSLL